MYSLSKIISESIVREKTSNHLILRCSALLGKYSRKNSLIKILTDSKAHLTLSEDSELNYVLHSDILRVIMDSCERNVQGTYNIISSQNITLEEMAEKFSKRVKFGSYKYITGKIDNSKAISLFPYLNKTSEQVITEFIK